MDTKSKVKGRSSIGRTADFGSANEGSNPSVPATPEDKPINPPAYTVVALIEESTIKEMNAADMGAKIAARIVKKFPQVEQEVLAPALRLEIGQAFRRLIKKAQAEIESKSA